MFFRLKNPRAHCARNIYTNELKYFLDIESLSDFIQENKELSLYDKMTNKNGWEFFRDGDIH